MAAVLASPACCGQSRRSIRSRTAGRCPQDSPQKAAMYTRGALVDMPQPLWDWWRNRVDVNGGLTERSLFRRAYPHSECNRKIRASRPGATYDGACKDMHPLQAPWTATVILASRSARTSWFAGRAMRGVSQIRGSSDGTSRPYPTRSGAMGGSALPRIERAKACRRKAAVLQAPGSWTIRISAPWSVRLMRDEHWSSKEIAGRIAMERPDLAASDASI